MTTLAQIYQAQLDRITDIITGELSGTNVAMTPPASIDTRLPVVVPLLQSDVNSKRGSTVYDFATTWRLHLYLSPVGQGLDTVNQANLYVYLGQFYQVFLSRRDLKYNGVGLPYCRDSEIQLVSALNDLQRYPPRNGQALHWGCQYDLTIYSTNVTLHDTI